MADVPGFAGAPGTRWVNDRGAVLWQAHCIWQSSCGRCIALDGRIAPYWPFPLHYSCNCFVTPVWPGWASSPFVDFRAEFARHSPAIRSQAIGDANRRLLEAGLASWDDIVTPGRIRPLHEVVAIRGLTDEDLIRVGVRPDIAARAVETAARAATTSLQSLGAAGVTIVGAGTTALLLDQGTGNPVAPVGGGVHQDPPPVDTIAQRIRTAIARQTGHLP